MDEVRCVAGRGPVLSACCHRPARPGRSSASAAQPIGRELIATEENKIQIFTSHNCILDLGLEPGEPESSQPAPPGLGPGPCSPGARSPPAVPPRSSSGTAGARAAGSGARGERAVSLCRHSRRRHEGTPGTTVPPFFPTGCPKYE